MKMHNAAVVPFDRSDAPSNLLDFKWHSDGDGRSILVGLPKSGVITGLSIELHGSGQDASRQCKMSGLADELARLGVMSLIPQAAHPFQLSQTIRAGFAWNVPGIALPGNAPPILVPIDDVGWISDVIARFRKSFSLASKPMFLCGYSGGARLGAHLLEGDHKWTGAAFVSGMRLPNSRSCCPPPTISFHGTDDHINPFAGNAGHRWDMGVRETAENYAKLQNCSSSVAQTEPPDRRVLNFYREDGSLQLSSHELIGANHAWPGSKDVEHLVDFGPLNTEVDATRLIVEFFEGRI